METITVKTKKPSFIGFAAFMIVLFTMPLGHAAMIIMEKRWERAISLPQHSFWDWSAPHSPSGAFI